jgi:hypothetical protein
MTRFIYVEICDEISIFDFDLDFDVSNLVNQISSSGNNWVLVIVLLRSENAKSTYVFVVRGDESSPASACDIKRPML